MLAIYLFVGNGGSDNDASIYGSKAPDSISQKTSLPMGAKILGYLLIN